MYDIIPVFLGWDKIITILFVIFNPLKVVGPFAAVTRETERALRRQLAWRAILFAGIGVVVATVMGERTLAGLGIRHAILLLAGGIIWFLIALFTVLQPYLPAFQRPPAVDRPSLALAFTPLAFPIIVTPYGVATLIILMATMQTPGQQVALLGLTAVMLLLNWAAMIFARTILRLLKIPLELVGWVLGVLQVAIALNLIYIALLSLRVPPIRP
jgi:multiple antibiotic resistance protein